MAREAPKRKANVLLVAAETENHSADTLPRFAQVLESTNTMRCQVLTGGAKDIPGIEDIEDVDLAVLARGTPGFSGADLANLVNEAALNAARYNQKVVRMHDFEFAKDKVLMGSERRSMIISDAEKRVTAIHEAGHALGVELDADAAAHRRPA